MNVELIQESYTYHVEVNSAHYSVHLVKDCNTASVSLTVYDQDGKEVRECPEVIAALDNYFEISNEGEDA